MNKSFEASWIIALIGSIITFIAFLTPAGVPTGDTDYVWMIGLSGREEIAFLTNHPLSLILSLFCSVIILSCNLLDIVLTILMRNKPEKNPHIAWFVTAFIMVIFTIVWVVLIHFFLPLHITRRGTISEEHRIYFSYTEYVPFWDYNVFGFGIYGILIGSVILIIGSAFRKFGSNSNSI